MTNSLRFACVFALTACGRIGFDSRGDNDFGSADGPTSGTAHVSTFAASNWLEPPTRIAGVTIAIADAAGQLRQVITSSGAADDVFIEAGWMIAAVFPRTVTRTRPFVQVIEGVRPFDDLAFGLFDAAPESSLGAMTLQLTIAGSSYTASTPCGLAGTSQTSLTVRRTTHCPDDRYDALVTVDAWLPSAQYAVVPVVFQDGATLQVTSYAPMETLAVTLEGIPAGRSAATLELDTLRDVHAVAPGDRYSTVNPPATIATTFLTQRSVGDHRSLEWSTSRSDLALLASQSRAFRRDLRDAAFTMTVDEMPWIIGADLDPDAGALSIDVDTAGHDAWLANILDTRNARADATVEWRILAPSDDRVIRFPELPPPYADWSPARGDSVDVNLQLDELDVWPDYAAARRTPFWWSGPLPAEAFARLGATEVGVSTAYVGYDPL